MWNFTSRGMTQAFSSAIPRPLPVRGLVGVAANIDNCETARMFPFLPVTRCWYCTEL